MSRQYKMYRGSEFWGYVWLTDAELATAIQKNKETNQLISYVLVED